MSELTPIAEQVAQSRYYLKDADGNAIETWKDLSRRVVNHVCQKDKDEQYKEEMFDLINQTKFLPNSPCLVNAGKDSKSQGLLACFVSKAPEDSWLGMLENIANFGHIARQGGGAGISLSKIRPEGDPVFGSTHAKACGPIEHMRMVSEVMSSITQSGFRGMACLSTLAVNHPDIKKFIVCKQRERALRTFLKEDIGQHFDSLNGKTNDQLNIILDKFIHNFNISVLATDDFMNKVKNNEDFNLEFNGKAYETVKAKDIFDMIITNAWTNGDPGFLFYDAMNSGPYKYSKQEITATNPCFHGDSKVAVADGRGFVSIRQLAQEGKDVPVYSCDPENGNIHIKWGRNPRKTRNNAALCKVTFHDGGEITTTPDHKILLRNGEYKEVEKLSPGDSVMPMTKSGELCEIHEVNHIVTSVEMLDETDDVYNITVDDFHNLCILSSEKTKQVIIKDRQKNVSRYYTVVYKNCGEQQLPEYGSCNLGSIDISKFFKDGSGIQWKDLEVAIKHCVRFLDNTISVNKWPTPEFEKWANNNRPVGLGIMGYADLLLKLQIPYGSEESISIVNKLGKFFQDKSHEASVELGKARGTPKCCKYKELDYRRNVTTLSIAPTGTISLLAGCSSSIEPVFSPVIFRKDNTGFKELSHPDANREYFRCAVSPSNSSYPEVTWQEHVNTQAAFQKYVDSAISKTINLPSSATKKDVADAFMLAWENGCKGITVYRDGSKSTQVLNSSKSIKPVQAPSRPKELPCDIHETVADGFRWHILIGLNDNNPYEIFAVNGKTELPEKGRIVKRKKRHYSLLDENGSILIENLSNEEAAIDPKIDLETRRFSLELRHGVPPKYIVQQIDKSNDTMTSFSKATARIMKKKYMSYEDHLSIVDDASCPECRNKGRNTTMICESGCWRCPNPECGFALCG